MCCIRFSTSNFNASFSPSTSSRNLPEISSLEIASSLPQSKTKHSNTFDKRVPGSASVRVSPLDSIDRVEKSKPPENYLCHSLIHLCRSPPICSGTSLRPDGNRPAFFEGFSSLHLIDEHNLSIVLFLIPRLVPSES